MEDSSSWGDIILYAGACFTCVVLSIGAWKGAVTIEFLGWSPGHFGALGIFALGLYFFSEGAWEIVKTLKGD